MGAAGGGNSSHGGKNCNTVHKVLGRRTRDGSCCSEKGGRGVGAGGGVGEWGGGGAVYCLH